MKSPTPMQNYGMKRGTLLIDGRSTSMRRNLRQRQLHLPSPRDESFFFFFFYRGRSRATCERWSRCFRSFNVRSLIPSLQKVPFCKYTSDFTGELEIKAQVLGNLGLCVRICLISVVDSGVIRQERRQAFSCRSYASWKVGVSHRRGFVILYFLFFFFLLLKFLGLPEECHKERE